MPQQPSGVAHVHDIPLDSAILKGLIDHELRTPLQTLLLFLHLAETKFAEHEHSVVDSARRALDELRSFHEGMASLFTDSGDADARSKGTAWDLARWIHAACKPHAITKGITLTGFDDAPKDVTIEHALEVRYLVLNLVRNAIKHGPAGGTVHLRWTTTASHQLLGIRDDGEGLSQLEPGTLNDTNLVRLYRSSEVENGLNARSRGLMLATQLANHLGGCLTYEHAPDKGCTFTFTLPHPISSKRTSIS